jgi:AcrR family transcriptional regulator
MRTSRRQRPASLLRRRQILDAALPCFLRQGFEATTIEQIRDASGASHGSIYHHFGSKEAIALALYEEGMHAYQQAVLEALARPTTAEAGIQALIATHLTWTAADPQRSVYLTRVSMADSSGATAERIAALNREFHDKIHDWLSPFIDRGEIIRISSALYMPLLLGPVSYVCRQWLAGRLPGKLPAFADDLAAAAWRALRAPPLKR